MTNMPGGTEGITLFGSTPADVKEATRLAISAALLDSRSGFSVKAAMMSGAYDAFAEAVEAAILAERQKWKDAAERAFDEGVAQETARYKKRITDCNKCGRGRFE